MGLWVRPARGPGQGRDCELHQEATQGWVRHVPGARADHQTLIQKLWHNKHIDHIDIDKRFLGNKHLKYPQNFVWRVVCKVRALQSVKKEQSTKLHSSLTSYLLNQSGFETHLTVQVFCSASREQKVDRVGKNKESIFQSVSWSH